MVWFWFNILFTCQNPPIPNSALKLKKSPTQHNDQQNCTLHQNNQDQNTFTYTAPFPAIEMNVDLDKYLRNFRIFYSKIVSGHPQQSNLQKKFKFLLENQAAKWRTGLFKNNVEESQNSIKSFLSKAKSAQSKTDTKKKKYEWLLETSNFSRCFVFVCVLSLLEAKSKEGIQMIRAHLENDGALVDGKMFNGVAFRKVLYAWSKMEKLFLNTFNTKPFISLGECLNELPEEFVDVMYSVLVDKRVPKLGVGQVTDDKLNKLADLIKVNMTYFEFENDKVSLVRRCGNLKKNVNIGYLPDEGIYVVAKELPKKDKGDEAERKTLVKLSKISTDLFKMYDTTDAKLRNLNSVMSTNPKPLRPTGMQAPPRMSSTTYRKGSISSMSLSRF